MAELWRQMVSTGDIEIVLGFRCIESHIVGLKRTLKYYFEEF